MSNRGPTISLGVGARQLRDRDWLSKSDPYLVISKPSVSGGFHVLRKSETKKNSLNPDWADFLFNENELSQHDLDLRLKVEVFDNDYGSSDQLLGAAHLSLKQLEAAALLQNCLPLGDGKGKNKAGSLVIRSFSRHPGQGGGHPGQGGGHPGKGGGHPGQFAGPHQTPSYPRPQASQYGYPIHPQPPHGHLPYPAQPAQGVPGVFYPPQGPTTYQQPSYAPTGTYPSQPAGPYPPQPAVAPCSYPKPYPPQHGAHQQPSQAPPTYPSLYTEASAPPPFPSAPAYPAAPGPQAYPAAPANPAAPAYPAAPSYTVTPGYPAYQQPATFNSPTQHGAGPGGFVSNPY